MTETRQQSPFVDPVAVEAWDAWFRWRHRGHLCDVSIEDTWRRVAGALVSVEAPEARAVWLSRFLEAFATWRLLPDERVLATAGTGRVAWRDGALGAALNAAAWVTADGGTSRHIDFAAVALCAELAVRVLDNAALLAGIPAPRLQIGLIGVADALAMLGYRYDSDAGRAVVAGLARATAEGGFCASTELAIERGAVSDGSGAAIKRAQARGMSPEWLRAARRHGLRHRRLTAIVPRPRLALLANNVADGLDPLPGANHPHMIASPHGQRTLYSSGYALGQLRIPEHADSPHPDTLARLPRTAQVAMRAAVQPWLDEPVAGPVPLESDPDSRQSAELLQRAATHGLGARGG